MNDERCETCRFWTLPVFYPPCRCRRYAPRPIQESVTQTASWPPTLHSDWCGDYRPAPSVLLAEMDDSIENLFPELSARVCHMLPCYGINKLSDLVRCSEADLYEMKNVGIISVRQIKAFLKTRGLHLRDESEADA